jgi:hypothetical protein
MPDLDLLRREHVGLAAIALQLSKVVAQPAPPPSCELYKLRMKLTSALVRHLKTEDWVLYPSLLGSSNERVALTARVFSTEMGGLAAEYGDYANRWGADAIDGDWMGYQRETANILRVLTLRMSREERDLYPLLEPANLERQRTD